MWLFWELHSRTKASAGTRGGSSSRLATLGGCVDDGYTIAGVLFVIKEAEDLEESSKDSLYIPLMKPLAKLSQ